MYTGFRFLGFIGMFIGPIVLIILKNIYEVRLDRGFVKSIFEKVSDMKDFEEGLYI